MPAMVLLYVEVACFWVVDDECACGLFRVDLPVFCECAADAVWLDEAPDDVLV